MLSKRDIPTKPTITRELVSDTTYTHVCEKVNTNNLAFSASRGLGAADGSSTAFLIHMGGFDDQQIVTTLHFCPPTPAASASIGPQLRVQTMDTNPSYYWARVDVGVAKITRVVSGTFATLASSAFTLAQEQDVTITFSVVGSTLSASFVADGGSPATVNLAATDTLIATGGLMGVRSLNSTIYCSAFTASQL